MVDSIAATSLLGHRPLCGGLGLSCKDISYKRKLSDVCRFPLMEFLGRRISASPYLPRRRGGDRLGALSIKALAMELTKEAHSYKEERIPRNLRYRIDTGIDRKPGLWPPENKVDSSSLHNPLLRQERMGCGWLGAIFEWEGVIIEDNPDLENQAWLALSQEEGKSPPPAFILRRIEGMKNEQAISEVLCWSRDPAQLRRMASRKEDIYQALQGGMHRLRTGSQEFVNVLMNYKIPMALVSTRPRKTLETAIGTIGIESYFSVIVAAEDVYRGKPDPEMFVYAAQLLNFIPERCIVFGNSNLTVEAAHDARMKCVAVASKHPVYELGAADLVVRHLDELSVVDLKNLADIESTEFGPGEPNLELVNECDSFPYYEDSPALYLEHLKNYHVFKVAGCDAALGYILNSTVEKFFSLSECWAVDSTNRTVTLVAPADATPEQRSQLVAKSLDKAVELGTFDILKGWRNEMYPVYGPGGEFLLEMERSATPLFGVVSYGVHSTCYVDDEDGLRIWVPRRSRTKQTYPGMLDNSVAGGMSTTEHPFECLVREAMEEASLPEDVVRANATAAGCVTYTYVRSSKAGGETDLVQPEVEYVFDIKVGADIIPKPCDTEVEEFKLYTVEETKAAMANGEFKPNCAVVLIDFFIRHGILTPENEPDYLEIVARVHRRFEFPTASHVTK